ncbi:MAG: ABC transporter ATP-binding protein [Acidothermus sp.]|nr:ABC transporter ATP-binding protein [Acidothermus sp.]
MAGQVPDDTVVRLTDVTVIRGGATLLANLDWQVRAGEQWAILGPNGAGKTTLLRLLATQWFPTRGSVEVLGERLGAVDVFEVRPRIGFASAALADRLPFSERVLDVVLTAGYAVIGRWREQYDDHDVVRARGMLEALGVAHLADRRYGSLSEGERKRVQIARALMSDPELLLLDEPAAGLDLGGREELLGHLHRLLISPRAPATVLVTHHVEEIPLGITHLLVLSRGRAVAAGPLTQTLSADTLSAAFGRRLLVEHRDGRYFAHSAPDG